MSATTTNEASTSERTPPEPYPAEEAREVRLF